MSMPEGSDYNYMWVRYVDSFSPAGNIFKTKEYARQIRKQEARQKKLREEREMDRMSHWEEQFRGGQGIHGYDHGGLVRVQRLPDRWGNITGARTTDSSKGRYNEVVPKFKPDQLARYRFMNKLSDQEAMARMMMAEDTSQQGGYAIAHLINNRIKNSVQARHSNIYSPFMRVLPQDREYAVDEKGHRLNYLGPRVNPERYKEGIKEFSNLKRILMGYDQFTPFRSGVNTRFFKEDWGDEQSIYDDYYDSQERFWEVKWRISLAALIFFMQRKIVHQEILAE